MRDFIAMESPVQLPVATPSGKNMEQIEYPA
jgi:hypothetical protein